MSRVLLNALAAVLVAAAVDGQTRPEPLRVDPLTATISGHITTADSGAPIRRAEVRAISDRGLTRLATTDDDGRYVVRDLPAGTFTVHVSKSGFVPLYFGQRRPTERRVSIALATGQHGAADVRLPRAGAITGRIVDASGEPVMGASVQALRRRMIDGQRGLQVAGSGDTTDDTGAYRIYGLLPGDYYVTATPRRIEDTTGRIVEAAIPGRGAPIFYPGTANRDEALRVTVDVSGEARADMQLTTVRTSRVSGVILSANGTPAAGAMVSLIARDLDVLRGGIDGLPASMLRIQDDAAADGTFELIGVPPGSFMLQAQTRPRLPDLERTAQPFALTMESALMPVVVTGDLSGLAVTTSQGGTVDVIVVADPAASGPPPAGARVIVRSGDRNEMAVTSSAANSARAPGAPAAGMTLALAVPSRIMVDGLPEGWGVKAVLLDNEDVTDTPVELRHGQNATLRVVLTDRTSDVEGVVGASGFGNNVSRAGTTIVVFAEDERKWSYPTRFVRIARTDERGAFSIPALPPGESYRAIAIDDIEDGDETDPDFLRRLKDRATRFSTREGELVTLDLRLSQP